MFFVFNIMLLLSVKLVFLGGHINGVLLNTVQVCPHNLVVTIQYIFLMGNSCIQLDLLLRSK